MQHYYKFGNGHADGTAKMKDLLGGKGANLAEMANLGIPVPPGITIPTTTCNTYLSAPNGPTKMVTKMKVYMQGLNEVTGGQADLRLYSVRSGARVSMPGMMDTILNVGITSQTLPAWKKRLGARAALDCYRRLIQMYGEVVDHIPASRFSEALTEAKAMAGVSEDSKLTATALSKLVKRYMAIYEEHTDDEFPDTLEHQLHGAICAVFDSWNTPRAKEYRNHYNIPSEWGTAVNIQSMVFGNFNDKSCTGVLFTRCPSTGDNLVVGEWLPNAQGEDVVAGIRTPKDIVELETWNPDVYGALMSAAEVLEGHYGDMQDVEFTVEDGELYLLQTRTGKRTESAAIRIAVDMIRDDGDIKTLLRAIPRAALFSTGNMEVGSSAKPDAMGLPAGGGAVCGRAYLTADAAAKAAQASIPVILLMKETTPDDLHGIIAADAILTGCGGFTSHAAVVARGMNKACVVGCGDIKVTGSIATLGDHTISNGDWITVDGASGGVWLNKFPVVKSTQGTPAIELLELLMPEGESPRGYAPEHAIDGRLVVKTGTASLDPDDDGVRDWLRGIIEAVPDVVFDVRYTGGVTTAADTLIGVDTLKPEESAIDLLHDVGFTGTLITEVHAYAIEQGMQPLGHIESIKDLISSTTTKATVCGIKRFFGDMETFGLVAEALEAQGVQMNYSLHGTGFGMHDLAQQYIFDSQE